MTQICSKPQIRIYSVCVTLASRIFLLNIEFHQETLQLPDFYDNLMEEREEAKDIQPTRNLRFGRKDKTHEKIMNHTNHEKNTKEEVQILRVAEEAEIMVVLQGQART